MQSSVGSDPNHYKFDGKERDTESGLDNFGARFDSSTLGRFMTPDWAAKPITVPYAKFGDPQSLNLYSFVENSPVDRIDPDGHVTSADFRCPDQRHCFDQAPSGNSCDNTADSCSTGEWSSNHILEAAQQSAEDSSQSSGCGWCQKLMNRIRGNGWKTDQQIAQENIDEGMPPNGEYNFLTGESCPDCKYYPSAVVEAIHAHEDQHRKDEHTLSGFVKLWTKKGKRELEVNAFKAELSVVERNIDAILSKGPPSLSDVKTLNILHTMKDESEGVIQNPNVYIP